MDYIHNMLDKITNYLPEVVGALLILVVGWLLASGISKLVAKLMRKTNLNKRLEKLGYTGVSPEKSIKRLVYYILMVLVLLLVLESLQIHNVLDPLKNMADEFLGFLPNLVAGILIGFAGYVIASVVAEMVGIAGNVLDSFSKKFKIDKVSIAKIAKQLVFIFIFIPVLIAAIDTLKVRAISEPATEMLSTFINTIPNIIGAALIIAVFYIGGTYIVTLLKELLTNFKIDEISKNLNLHSIIGEKQSLADILSSIAFFFIMFTGIVTAVEKLEFVQIADTLGNLLVLSGQIFLGLIVLTFGNFISRLATDAISKSENNPFLASIVRVATLGLFLAMALRTMNIANEIVNWAFILTLGSIAVAVALAFGLGGREAAGKQMEYIFAKFRKSEEAKTKTEDTKSE